MYDEMINFFRSEYDKNILLYGKETIYEKLEISDEVLYNHLIMKRSGGLYSIPVCFGVRIGYKTDVGVILIFERISFTTKNINLLKTLFENKTDANGEKLLQGMFFIDCQFSTPLEINSKISADVCFRNCVFKRCNIKCVTCSANIVAICFLNPLIECIFSIW